MVAQADHTERGRGAKKQGAGGRCRPTEKACSREMHLREIENVIGKPGVILSRHLLQISSKPNFFANVTKGVLPPKSATYTDSQNGQAAQQQHAVRSLPGTGTPRDFCQVADFS
ncbi:hypothetical protein LP419_02115 [Massilia sp. H-1]|nr:hypothetical protein LP419_02115 [Massilia sp. H-1]